MSTAVYKIIQTMEIQMYKTYSYNFTNEVKFGSLPVEILYKLFQDGRNASFMLEEWLAIYFPSLTRVEGNKDHDHIDTNGVKYDAKNFTKKGLKFMPSNQIGKGRTFDKTQAHEKAVKLVYICCDIVDFPQIHIRFIPGKDLMKKYPKCSVLFSKRSELFNSDFSTIEEPQESQSVVAPEPEQPVVVSELESEPMVVSELESEPMVVSELDAQQQVQQEEVAVKND